MPRYGSAGTFMLSIWPVGGQPKSPGPSKPGSAMSVSPPASAPFQPGPGAKMFAASQPLSCQLSRVVVPSAVATVRGGGSADTETLTVVVGPSWRRSGGCSRCRTDGRVRARARARLRSPSRAGREPWRSSAGARARHAVQEEAEDLPELLGQ
jgi:hypothetical protein